MLVNLNTKEVYKTELRKDLLEELQTRIADYNMGLFRAANDDSDLDIDFDDWESTEKVVEAKILVISVQSAGFDAGNFAKIAINGVEVHMTKNCNNHQRGLHIVVINSETGKIEVSQVFDTYQSSAAFNDFIATDIPMGHIVVAACKDDCVTNLSKKGK